MTLLRRIALLLVSIAGLGVFPASAQPVTGLWLSGENGALGPGDRFYQAPADSWTYVARSSSNLDLLVNWPNADSVRLAVQAPAAQTFAVGSYELASSGGILGPNPGLDLTVGGRACESNGRFVVLEVSLDATSKISSFAANFEHRCDGASASTYGEIRINSSVPFTSAEPAGAVVPDAYAFLAKNQARRSTAYISNEVTVYGINAPSTISITGGEYSVNGGAFTAATGSVTNRDHIRVRVLSSDTLAATRIGQLSMGGVTAQFAVRTFDPEQAYSALYLKQADGTEFEAYESRWSFATSTSEDGRAIFNLNGPGEFANIEFAAPPGDQLQANRGYEEAVRAAFREMSPGLDVGTSFSAHCVSGGRFAVLDYQADASGKVTRFAANGEYWCQGGSGPSFVELRYRSTVPLTFLKSSPSTTPDPFALVARLPVKAGSLVTSNWFGIYGVDSIVPVSVTGGEYSVNGAPFTAASTSVGNLDDIVARVRASGAPGGLSSATLTVGGRSEAFSVQTYQPGTPLSGLAFRSAGVFLNGSARLLLAPRSRISVEPTYWNGQRVHVSTTAGEYFYLPIWPPTGSTLSAGEYDFASQPDATRAGVNLYGSASGCSNEAGRMVIREIGFSGGTVNRLAADMELRCNPGEPMTPIEVRYNSAVPISGLTGPSSPLDFNRDGKSDILFRNTSSGEVFRALMDGSNASGGSVTYREPDTAWQIVGDGDFNGDGVVDLLWRHALDGRIYVMLLGAGGVPASGAVIHAESDASWKIVQTPDLNGDGRSDLVWWNSRSGAVYYMLMSGTTIAQQGIAMSEPDLDWRIVASGDFRGSGRKNQLVWRNQRTGALYLMTVNVVGTPSVTGQVFYVEPLLTWKIAGAGDFNGDGKTDLVWRNESTGAIYVMLMNGASVAGGGNAYREPNLAWNVIATGDYDGDGKADLLWRNEGSGQVYAMLMNGATVASGSVVWNEPNTAWKLLGPAEYAAAQ